MKLTCVTAVFNAIKSGNRENLIRCVRSVAALKTPHEHLIYDGASTDGTVELLRELEQEINNSATSHSSLLTIHSEKDTGIYNALNKGVRDAQGEWFYVLGCDDYICHPEVMDDLLAQVKRDVEIIITPVETNSGFRNISRQDLFKMMPYCHQGVIASVRVIRECGGFDERLRISADYKLMLKAHLRHSKFFYTDSYFAHFTAGGASGNFDKMIAEVACVHAELFDLKKANVSEYKYGSALPPKVWFPYLFDSDEVLRTSAREMLRIYFKGILRIAFYPIVVITRPLRYGRKN